MLWKLPVAQLVSHSPTFYGTQWLYCGDRRNQTLYSTTQLLISFQFSLTYFFTIRLKLFLHLRLVSQSSLQGFRMENMCSHVGYQVNTSVDMNISVFRDVTPYSLLEVSWSFGTHRFHLQGKELAGKKNVKALDATCFHAGLLLSLLFDPEDWSNIPLRNVNSLSSDYMALYLTRQNCLHLVIYTFFYLKTTVCSSNSRSV